MVYSNGDRYNGEWKNDTMNGIGVYQYANGDRYEGGWKDGLMDGEGIITFSDGSTYKSKWRNEMTYRFSIIVYLAEGWTKECRDIIQSFKFDIFC